MAYFHICFHLARPLNTIITPHRNTAATAHTHTLCLLALTPVHFVCGWQLASRILTDVFALSCSVVDLFRRFHSPPFGVQAAGITTNIIATIIQRKQNHPSTTRTTPATLHSICLRPTTKLHKHTQLAWVSGVLILFGPFKRFVFIVALSFDTV